MGSRAQILENIKANKPEALPLPQIDPSIFYEDLDLVSEFTKKVEIVGGHVINEPHSENIHEKVKALFPETKTNLSTLEHSESFNTVDITGKKPQDLEDLDILILKSDIAVAENGAVWVNDQSLPVRVLPFITKHLVLVVPKNNILPYMHQAYDKITANPTDFGVFISGPSKTADIEQSLVIGAHGALSLTVFLTEH